MVEQNGHETFDDRLQAAKRKLEPTAPSPGSPGAGGGSSNAMSIGLRVGVELVSALAVAAAIGWWLDRWLHTSPVLLAVFVLLGGGAGIANVWRLMGPRRG